MRLRTLWALPLVLATVGCGAEEEPRYMTVMASAYNSLPDQTNDEPTLAAWGDRLQPGMKVIAVSRDLLGEGLAYGTEVRIKGLRGRYRVLDKMHPRWTRKIDIYMGNDERAALDWGVRKVQISWVPIDADDS